MREILFKAKRKDNSEWVQGWLLKDEVTGQYFIHASGNSVNESDKVNEEGCLRFVAFEVDEHTICQYTGLTDKNGNKIWENDIVIYDNSPYNVYCTPHTGNIAYRNGCLCFKYWLYGSINYMPFTADVFFGSKCEVIGNTIENPELLDNKTDC